MGWRCCVLPPAFEQAQRACGLCAWAPEPRAPLPIGLRGGTICKQPAPPPSMSAAISAARLAPCAARRTGTFAAMRAALDSRRLALHWTCVVPTKALDLCPALHRSCAGLVSSCTAQVLRCSDKKTLPPRLALCAGGVRVHVPTTLTLAAPPLPDACPPVPVCPRSPWPWQERGLCCWLRRCCPACLCWLC